MKRNEQKSVIFLMDKNQKIIPTNRRKKGGVYNRECGWNFAWTLIEYEL